MKKEVKPFTLHFLLGYHVLTGCDHIPNYSEDGDDIATAIAFEIDGVKLVAVEDPSDGYRSSLEHLILYDGEIVNKFPPCHVSGLWEARRPGADDDPEVICLKDVYTQQPVLEVGTSRNDSYYPCFVARFDPTAMLCNEERIRKLEQP